MRPLLLVAALVAAAPFPALAQGPAAPQPNAGGQTAQQRYAAAQAAFDAGRWQEAHDGFTTLLPRLRGATAALVGARAGAAALALGRPEDALPLIEAALPRLTGDERATALHDVATARERLSDFAGAAAAYADAAAALGGETPLPLRVAQARAAIFADPKAAAAQLEALAPAAAAAWKDKPRELGLFHTLRGRAALMAGDHKGARAWFGRALDAEGPLSASNVSIRDVQVRGDAALAAWLVGDRESARRYLAFTGAGALAEQGFRDGVETALPTCGEDGIQPDDAAVVEFGIAADGRVARADTVWASRLGGPEAAFARAVRGWSWTPEAAAKLPAWWRAAIRLELRCESGRLAGVPNEAVGDLTGWFGSRGAAVLPYAPSDAARLPLLRAAVADREAAGGASLAAALAAVGFNAAAPATERRAALTRAAELLAALNAPADLRTLLLVRAAAASDHAGSPRAWREMLRSQADTLGAEVARLRAAGQLGGRGGAFALLHLAHARAALNDRAGALAAWTEVTAMPEAALPAANLLRQRALLQLANAAAAERRSADAQRFYALTGLQPGQCALLDAPPRQRSAGVTAGDFPMEARRWNFEGFARLSFDITADGRVEGARTVMASPPFVFSEGSVQTARGFRFDPVFRPDGGKGCIGAERTINYRIAPF